VQTFSLPELEQLTDAVDMAKAYNYEAKRPELDAVRNKVHMLMKQEYKK